MDESLRASLDRVQEQLSRHGATIDQVVNESPDLDVRSRAALRHLAGSLENGCRTIREVLERQEGSS